MRFAAFTVDVDRDVNQACPGELCALSKEGEGLGRPRFDSSARGLEVIVRVLNGLDVRGTFFFEARTAVEISKRTDLVALMRGHEVACHAYDHEDLTGEKSGLRPTDVQIDDILDRSLVTMLELFGVDRMGFRSPYLVTDERLRRRLVDRRFKYDSSVIEPIKGGMIRPYAMPEGVVQVPVASGLDREGRKIVGYLWPMHEGKRVVEDYVQLAKQFDDGLLVLATHSWHLVENFCDGALDEAAQGAQRNHLEEIISNIMEQGVDFIRIDDYLDEHFGRER